MSDNPFTDFIASQPGIPQQILDTHTADSYGNCVVCSGQTSSMKFPCALVWHATEARKVQEFAVRFNPFRSGEIVGPFQTREAAEDFAATNPEKGSTYRILTYSDGRLLTGTED